MIDFLPPFDVEAKLAALARPEDPHRLADGDRGRLLHFAGDPDASTRRIPTSSRTPRTRSAEDRLRPHRAGLKRRRAAGVRLHVMSCDNIPGNGHVTRERGRGLAELSDPELARLDPRERRLPQLDGRPHHSGDQRPRARLLARARTASRTPGRCSARNSGNGWSRTSSRPDARRWRRSASPSPPTSRPMS